MDALKDLANKASAGKMAEPEQDKAREAKMAVLKHIHKMASDAMGEDIKGGMADKHTADADMTDLSQNKAMVSADSREGLEKGLDKAKELVSQHGLPLHSNEMDDEDMGESAEEEAAESPAEEAAEDLSPKDASEHDDMSDEELEHLIAELQARKAKK
jgi:hypothetical protein